MEEKPTKDDEAVAAIAAYFPASDAALKSAQRLNEAAMRQRLLRAVLLILSLLSGLVAISAGISLALEVAGLLNLIDDPVSLPVGIQLATFVAAAGVGLKRVLKPVERALYGSKGIGPKTFQR